MSAIAADSYRVYRLDGGAITQSPRSAFGNFGSMPQPPGSVVDIACSLFDLYALNSNGDIYRRNSGIGNWGFDSTFAGASKIAASEKYLYVSDDNMIYRKIINGAKSFPKLIEVRGGTITSIDHDERYLFATTADDRIIFIDNDGSWSTYPKLGNVKEVVASREILFVRTGIGAVYKSHSDTRSGWARVLGSGAISIAAPSDHEDILYIETENGVVIAPNKDSVVTGYISSDYSGNWAETE